MPRCVSNCMPMSSNPGRGKDLYPMLRKKILQGMVTSAGWPLERKCGRTFAFGEKGSEGSSSLRLNLTWDNRKGNLGDQCNEWGDSKNSRDHDFVAASGLAEEPLASSSISRFWARGSEAMTDLGGSRSCGMGSNETDGSCSSSRISLIVKAA